jgi:poly-gamma-glutamate capsule biosynthesis protein CapA/YwtB (metallophosphatase superfamily)
MMFTLAITGDSIINRRLSVYRDENFISLVKILREADVAITHFETLIHDYDGPGIYPAAEAGGTWMRSPRFVVDELKWMGFDLVSCASNHSLDYSYGGLFSTMKALAEGGIPYAGVGRNLGEAREPAYLETGKGRVALVSVCSTLARWATAGDARSDVKGRPGVNPLRYHFVVDSKTISALEEIASKTGFHTIRRGKARLFIPPGLYNTIYKFVAEEGSEVYHKAEERDVEGNLKAVKEARRQADYVIVHLHCHEWQPGAIYRPAKFVYTFAKRCIDAGADVFIQQGAHRGIGGIEVYKDRPIIYDPGDFIVMHNTVTRLPTDFYLNETYSAGETRLLPWDSTPSEAFDAREKLNPMKDYAPEVAGSLVIVCIFEGNSLRELRCYPVIHITNRPQSGIPILAKRDEAKRIIEYLGKMSSLYGTEVTQKDDVGIISINPLT